MSIMQQKKNMWKNSMYFHALNTQQIFLSAYSAPDIMDERTHSQPSICLQYRELKPHKEKI